MTKDYIIDLVKSFCQEKQFKYVDDIHVGKSVLVLISGKDCAKAYDLFLKEQGLEHTTPMKIVDGIGSYINID